MEMLAEIWATLQEYSQLIGVLAMFFGPALLGRVVRFIQARRQGHSHSHGPQSMIPNHPMSKGLLAIVVLHGLYAAYTFYIPPYDVFTSHKLVIRTPTEMLRPRVLRAAGITAAQVEDHPLISELLARLTSLDARYAYARWGHATFLRCTWCRDQYDFALAVIPNLLLPYVYEALLIGVMGWQTIGGPGATERKSRFRSVAGWALGAMLAADIGLRLTLEIRAGNNNDCLHLDPTLHLFRTIALFLTTAAYAFFPLPQDARAAEVTTLRILESALYTQRLTSLVRTAVSRSPAMTRISTELRDKRARAEDAVRADPEVIAAAHAAGIIEPNGNEYSANARANARSWIETQWSRTVGGRE